MNEQDKEAFGKWFDKNWQDSDDKDVFTQAWQAACLYKQKEIDELRLQYDKLTDWASEYVAKNRKLKECVKWYADPKNCDNIDFTHCEWCERTEEEIADAGFRARQCLKELEEK